MNTNEKLVELLSLDEPAILLKDGRILKYQDFGQLETVDYMDITENSPSLIVERRLIPDNVRDLDIYDYMEFAHTVVVNDNPYCYEDVELFEIIESVVDIENNYFTANLYLPKRDFFSEQLVGKYDNFENFASELFKNEVEPTLPEHLLNFFDYAKWLDTLDYDYRAYDLSNGDVAIFHE